MTFGKSGFTLLDCCKSITGDANDAVINLETG